MSKSKKAAIGLEPNTVTEVPLIAISPDPDQPRKTFDEASLLALADNIRERGVQQPLLVRNVGGSTGLMIVDGERRWRAAKLAKVKAVPVLLVDDGSREEAQLDAALNIVNELPWRETHALARLIWGNDLHTVWNLDREFLDLFRKAELVHLAGVHSCALPEGRRSWDAMKGDDIKDALLTQHDKLLRPAILADLYQREIEEPFRAWRPGDEDPDYDEDGEYFPEEDEEKAA